MGRHARTARTARPGHRHRASAGQAAETAKTAAKTGPAAAPQEAARTPATTGVARRDCKDKDGAGRQASQTGQTYERLIRFGG